jgi:hypothetical protein
MCEIFEEVGVELVEDSAVCERFPSELEKDFVFELRREFLQDLVYLLLFDIVFFLERVETNIDLLV